MSIQDIIYITPEEFKSRVGNATKCEKINEMYSKLLSQYDCFTKPDLVLLKFPTTTKSHGANHKASFGQSSNERGGKNEGKKSYNSFRSGSQHGHNNNHHNNHNRQIQSNYTFSAKRPQLKALMVESDVHAVIKRQLKGFLNIINKNNYNKLSNKIKQLVNAENIDVVVAVLLDTACCQVFYVSIFYRLLTDVIAASDDTAKRVARNHINSFIEDFVGDKEYMYVIPLDVEIVTSESKYIKFCNLQKHKCLATSKNLVILELLKNRHSAIWNEQLYCTNLLQTITVLQKSEEMSNDDIDQNIDIILCMMKDIKNKCRGINIDPVFFASITSLLGENQRVKFMIEDLTR